MKLRRILYTTACILGVWIFLAQCVILKNRISDAGAYALFGRHQTSLRINDTVVNGHKIHYGITGNDTLPTLIFIHGSPGSWTNYRACMWDSMLRSTYRMVSIDRPGFGYSDFGNVLHLQEQAATILPVIQSLKNGKPITLFGHSMGAPVAVQIAASDPSLINRLVLAGAPLDVRQEQPELWRRLMDKGPLPILLPGAFSPSNRELLYLKKDLLQLETEFARITAAVYFFHGDKDSWVPIENVGFGISKMVNAVKIQSDTLTGAGHLIPWENQEEFLEYLRRLD